MLQIKNTNLKPSDVCCAVCMIKVFGCFHLVNMTQDWAEKKTHRSEHAQQETHTHENIDKKEEKMSWKPIVFDLIAEVMCMSVEYNKAFDSVVNSLSDGRWVIQNY